MRYSLLFLLAISSAIYSAEIKVAFVDMDEVLNRTESISLQLALAGEEVRTQLAKIKQEKSELIKQLPKAVEEEDINEINRKNMLLNKKESFLMQGFQRRNEIEPRKMLYAYIKLKYAKIPVILLMHSNTDNSQLVLSQEVEKLNLTNETIESLLAELK